MYRHTCVSSCPGLISVARVNEYRTTDVTRVLKTPGAELSQNACGKRTKNILFSSVFSRVLNDKFRAYISMYTCFVLVLVLYLCLYIIPRCYIYARYYIYQGIIYIISKVLYICLYVHVYIFINFICHVQMSKNMYKKPRHFFISIYLVLVYI